MNDLPERLRRHYAEQSLSPDAVQRILAQASAERRRRWSLRFAWAMAAALMMGLVAYWAYNYTGKVEASDVERRVEAFFAAPDPQLDRQSPDSEALREWLVQQGAPAAAQIPPTLKPFPSVGCVTLQVGRQKVYMLCFKVDLPGAGAADPSRSELVHVVFVDRSSLRHAPPPREAAVVVSNGKWSYTSWSDPKLAYVVVSLLPPQKLGTALGVNRGTAVALVTYPKNNDVNSGFFRFTERSRRNHLFTLMDTHE